MEKVKVNLQGVFDFHFKFSNYSNCSQPFQLTKFTSQPNTTPKRKNKGTKAGQLNGLLQNLAKVTETKYSPRDMLLHALQ